MCYRKISILCKWRPQRSHVAGEVIIKQWPPSISDFYWVAGHFFMMKTYFHYLVDVWLSYEILIKQIIIKIYCLLSFLLPLFQIVSRFDFSRFIYTISQCIIISRNLEKPKWLQFGTGGVYLSPGSCLVCLTLSKFLIR
jgi:hypothetical protein